MGEAGKFTWVSPGYLKKMLMSESDKAEFLGCVRNPM
jgi:hypothetical protein